VAELTLETPVQYVRRVGPVRAEQLRELGIETVEDVLMYFPRRYDLRRGGQPIATLTGEEDNATVVARIVETRENRFGRRPWFEATLEDDSGMVNARWFHGSFLKNRLQEGMTVAVTGKTSVYKSAVQFIQPQVLGLFDREGRDVWSDELLPVYPAGGKLSSTIIAQVVQQVLPEARRLVPRWFPPAYCRQRGLMERPEAVTAMHRPQDRRQWALARKRLAYDECLLMQLAMAILRSRAAARPAYRLEATAEIDRRIRARLPFDLTAAQDRSVAEIAADLDRPHPMNRLLQGDVGSGKTVVALYAALTAVAHRKQVALMAPTEILARQHFEKIEAYLAGSRVRMALLTGGQAQARREQILQELAAGRIDLLVGTQALLGEGVKFAQLALVIVDEQHKFGVRQRSGFRSKGYAPHYLVMTATPIPRTMAMTVFGDLDVSVIDELPPGRGKIQTRATGSNRLEEVLRDVRSRVEAGQQAYLIYPLVKSSPDSELTSAQQAFEELAEGPLAGVEAELVHGQLPAAQKEEAMRRFVAGEVRVLVSSVVVEVGVDVPTANVMVVMHAERFGLAQLHQLRGRIGRGADDAICYLVAEANNPVAQRRIEVLAETQDGFQIAEEDLRLRGPGEIFGTRQHGLPELKVADLVEDFALLRRARRDAQEIIAGDPSLDLPGHQALRRELVRSYAGRLDLLGGA
jgi:ATP-dependent DNA helicase RecG